MLSATSRRRAMRKFASFAAAALLLIPGLHAGAAPSGPFTQVRFTNQITPADDVPFPFLTTHLHGGHTAPEHDGHPDDLFGPFPAPWPYPITEPLPAGRPAPATNAHTYAYTNDQQPQVLWYHD